MVLREPQVAMFGHVSVSWAEVERTLCRIPHVTRAHVVRDAADHVRELHIVATAGKPAKQLVRDVQSVAMASFGVAVDRHVVSVVQLDVEDAVSPPEPVVPVPEALEVPGPRAIPEAGPGEVAEPPQAPQPRAVQQRTLLAGMTLQSQQGRSSVSIALRWDGREAVGSAEGTPSSRALHRLAAEATLDALAQLHPAVPAVDVEAVEVRSMGAGRLALVSVVQRSSDDVLVGTAQVRAAGEFDAVARAVLDAVNRRLSE